MRLFISPRSPTVTHTSRCSADVHLQRYSKASVVPGLRFAEHLLRRGIGRFCCSSRSWCRFVEVRQARSFRLTSLAVLVDGGFPWVTSLAQHECGDSRRLTKRWNGRQGLSPNLHAQICRQPSSPLNAGVRPHGRLAASVAKTYIHMYAPACASIGIAG